MTVSERSEAISGREHQWQIARDVFEGEDAIKADATYLPPLSGQQVTSANYMAYRDRALFFNAFARTIDALRGLVFRRDVTVKAGGTVEGWLDDITLTGQSLHAFAEEAFDDLLVVTWGGLWVDHTRPPVTPQTRAEARGMDIRPYLRFFRAEDILEIAMENVGGAQKMTRVRLFEVEERQSPEDEFSTEVINQWRVLELVGGVYQQRLFQSQQSAPGEDLAFIEITEEPIVPLRNGQPLDHIPFYPFGNRGFIVRPPKPVLLDLARTNVSHFKTMADLENGAHFTGFPMPVLASDSFGSEIGVLEVGTQQGWQIPDSNAKWGYLSYGAEGLKTLEDIASRKEYMMAMQGARMLLPEKLAAEAADTVRLRRYGETSVLGAIAISLSEALTWAVGEMAEWGGSSGEVEVTVNRDFDPTMLDPAMLREMRDTWKIGGITMEMWLDMLKRGELVDPEMTVEEFRDQGVEGVNDPVTLSQVVANLVQGGVILGEQVDPAVLQTSLRLPEGLIREGTPPPLLTGQEDEEDDFGRAEEMEAAQ